MGYPQGKFITWGDGGFQPDNWATVRDFILKHGFKTVIEYGCGVSTELLIALGMKVTSLETQAKFADIPRANIIVCAYGEYPELGAFDFAFIDGPGAYEFESAGKTPERRLSAEHAKRHARAVYMHDGGLGQPEVFDGDPAWECIRGGDTELIYMRKS